MKTFMLLAGMLLLINNIIGLFLPLRNEGIYHEKNTGFENDITLTEEQLYKVINTDIANREKYILQLNKAINKGIAHYWNDNGIDRYNLRVPIYENYLLYFASYIYPKIFRKYEYSHYDKAIERGIGLCSQHAIIISEILNEKGIESKIIRLSGHVVSTALVNKEKNLWWILDPDYGVVIKADISKVEDNPEIVRNYYQNNGFDKKTVENLINIYDKDGNTVIDSVRSVSQITSYAFNYYVEIFTYIVIWIFPILLMTPYLISLRRKSCSCRKT